MIPPLPCLLICFYMSISTCQNEATGKGPWLTPLRLRLLSPSMIIACLYHCSCLAPVFTYLKGLYNGGKKDLNLMSLGSCFVSAASICSITALRNICPNLNGPFYTAKWSNVDTLSTSGPSSALRSVLSLLSMSGCQPCKIKLPFRAC